MKVHGQPHEWSGPTEDDPVTSFDKDKESRYCSETRPEYYDDGAQTGFLTRVLNAHVVSVGFFPLHPGMKPQAGRR